MAQADTYRWGISQSITFNTSAGPAVASAALKTRVIRLASTAPCHVVITGTATATSGYLPANWPELMSVTSGDVLSVIGDVGAGVLTVTALAN